MEGYRHVTPPKLKLRTSIRQGSLVRIGVRQPIIFFAGMV
jgi:hypothetical protein